MDIVKPHAELVTSIMSYCGLDVADNATIITTFYSTCKQLFPALSQLGIRSELALNAGNCSIDVYRRLWADTIVSPATLLSSALAANATGINIDLEPQVRH